jgi:hypothetical protein
MQTFYESLGVHVPEIYLPEKNADRNKRAVVACDQYTSQPDYRKNVETYVGNEPSTLKLIFPEVYLEEDQSEERINNIHATMQAYLADGTLRNHGRGFVYIDRKTSHATSRKGLIIALDLEHYDYSKGSQTLIRATEGTIVDRLPPRIKIRKEAPLESPHIMVLIDDPDKQVIEPLAAKLDSYTELYNFELMMKG